MVGRRPAKPIIVGDSHLALQIFQLFLERGSGDLLGVRNLAPRRA